MIFNVKIALGLQRFLCFRFLWFFVFSCFVSDIRLFGKTKNTARTAPFNKPGSHESLTQPLWDSSIYITKTATTLVLDQPCKSSVRARKHRSSTGRIMFVPVPHDFWHSNHCNWDTNLYHTPKTRGNRRCNNRHFYSSNPPI